MLLMLSAIISAALYRIGGAGREEIPFANSQYRDTGIPILLFLYLTFIVGATWYLALIVGLAVCGLIRTYWDFIDGNDNMYLHGGGIGVSFIPLAWHGVGLHQIVLYTLILAVSMGALNTFCNRVRVPYSVWVEELFRGFIIFVALGVML